MLSTASDHILTIMQSILSHSAGNTGLLLDDYASIGANIGSTQNYVRVYTERLIAYLNGKLPIEK